MQGFRSWDTGIWNPEGTSGHRRECRFARVRILEVGSLWNRVRVTRKLGNGEAEYLRDLRKSHGSQVGKASQS